MSTFFETRILPTRGRPAALPAAGPVRDNAAVPGTASLTWRRRSGGFLPLRADPVPADVEAGVHAALAGAPRGGPQRAEV